MWFSLAGLFVATLAAVGTVVLHEFSRHELEELCRRKRRDELFGRILDEYEFAAFGAQALHTLGAVLFVMAGLGWYVGPIDETGLPTFGSLSIGVGVGALVLVAVSSWLPWAITRVWSASFLFYTWPLWKIIGWVFLPLTAGTHLLESVFLRLAGRPDDEETEEEEFEDELRAIVTEGQRDGLLEPDAREMIEGVIELGDADVADLMTPRSRIEAISLRDDWPHVIDFVIGCGRTRIPVYDGKLDHIVGVLYVKDLLRELAKPEGERRPLRQILRDPWFIPKTTAVDRLLREFLDNRNHMALVVDEYHSVAGLITIEDVLEEIVGEIVDEHDSDEIQEIQPIDEHTAEVLGVAHLDEINEALGLALPEDEEFDTIAGLMLARLGRIPKVSEKLAVADVRLIVLEATSRRIERVRIESRNGSAQ
jgi:CBS domain containing-hemolysin-like protein